MTKFAWVDNARMYKKYVESSKSATEDDNITVQMQKYSLGSLMTPGTWHWDDILATV